MSQNTTEYQNRDEIVSKYLISQYKFSSVIEPMTPDELMSMDFNELKDIYTISLSIIAFYEAYVSSHPDNQEHLKSFKEYITSSPVKYEKIFEKIISFINNSEENEPSITDTNVSDTKENEPEHIKKSLSEIYKDLGSLPFYGDEENKYQMSVIVKKKRTENKIEMKHIALEHIISLLQTDDFILKINKNLEKLYNSKINKYSAIFSDLNMKINEENRQLILFKTLLSTRHPEDKFPSLENNIVLREKIRTFISRAHSKISKINSSEGITQTRDNLVEAITNEDKGIMSIIGNTRENIRGTLFKQIFILSRTSRLFVDNFLNIILTGGSGFGKTKIATVIGFVFSKIGILLTDDVYCVSPKDLVSKWVGDSALKTTGILMSGLESVIFIDECYQISEPSTTNSHGRESLSELVNFMDKYMGLSVIICAGYKDKVYANFIGGNEGVERRFPIIYELSKYSSIDLTNIFMSNVKKMSKVNFNDDMKKYIFTMISHLNKFNVFENQSGDILNLTQIFFQTFYSSVDGDDTSVELFDVAEISFKLYVDCKGLFLHTVNEQEFNISQKIEIETLLS